LNKLEDPQEILEDGSPVDFFALALRMFKYWYFFAISTVLSIIGAYFYTKFSTSVVEVTTTLMIQTDAYSGTSERVLEGMDLFSNKKNIMNEKLIIQSYPAISETIRRLNFNISYFSENGYVKNELYTNSPFYVVFDSASPQPINVFFKIEQVSNDEFIIQSKSENLSLFDYRTSKVIRTLDRFSFKEKHRFDETIKTKDYNFKVVRNPLGTEFIPELEYYFVFNDIKQLILKYKSEVKINQLEKGVDVLVISMRDNNVNKTTDFLNELTSVYISRDLERKNSIANNTIKFIDGQLSLITDSLSFAENQLQSYRSSNKIMNIDFQSQQLFTKLGEYQNEKAILISKKEYYNYLVNSINGLKNLEDLMIPSTIGINDPALNKLVGELVDLNSERLTLRSNTLEKSQALINIERKIENSKKMILENLSGIIEANNFSLKDVEKKVDALEEEAKKLPMKQQKLFNYERVFKLNDAIYTFLLQKRADAQISKASNIPDCEVIDAARSDVFEKKSAKYRSIYLIAILIGLFIPGLSIYIEYRIRDLILARKDIEQITKTPIVGGIIQYKKPITKVFIEYPKSTIAESFRSFYTNLQYFIKGKEQQVILVTSSMPKEGKTFSSINLASVYASFGKKTCLLSFDLRLAKVHQAFDISDQIGISTFLINYSIIDDIIFGSGIENLDIIPAGPVPPNPVELIASGKTDELFEILRKRYECIVIDSPPLGVVADAQLLSKYSDINVIVVRQNHTRKKVFNNVIKELESNEIQKKAILFNGIKEYGIYGYSYGYGYGYNYGYYKEYELPLWKRIIKKGKEWKKKKNENGT
jgi:capsular exopolysaccharide synthesis family protein